MKWDAAGTCVHSLLKCGECRHKEKELNANGLAAVDEDVAAYRKKALDEYWAKQGAPAPNPPAFPAHIPVAQPPPLKLDLGCGPRKQPGFIGVDARAFPGVDTVCDLATATWPWPDNSVEEGYCAHMLEHIPGKEVDWELDGGKLLKKIRYPRAHFFNELWRVLKPGGKAAFVTPYWCSCRAFGDITHEWPPVSEFSWLYLDKQWRKDNAPHDDMYSCDFTHGYGYNLAPHLLGRNDEHRGEALRDHKEAAQDMLATVVARK